jgi:hypothetical protein
MTVRGDRTPAHNHKPHIMGDARLDKLAEVAVRFHDPNRSSPTSAPAHAPIVRRAAAVPTSLDPDPDRRGGGAPPRPPTVTLSGMLLTLHTTVAD